MTPNSRPPRVVWGRVPRWTIRWLVVPLAVAALLHAFVLGTYWVSGESMERTLAPGDLLLVWKLARPAPGEIAVFRLPAKPSLVLVKRVVAGPGERVPDIDHVVPPDHLFVVGDNRAPGASSDSREWGDLPSALVVGRAVLRLWPPGRVGALR